MTFAFKTRNTLVILDGKIDRVSVCENCCRLINMRATVEGGEVVGIEVD